MSATNRASINHLLWVGIDSVFGLDMKENPQVWQSIYDKRTSRKAWEEAVQMKSTGFAQIYGEDEPIKFDMIRNSWKHIIEHEKYGLAVRITEEAKDDNQYMQMIPVAGKALSRSMRATQDARAAEPFNRALDLTRIYGDGKPLLAVDHPLDATVGGVFSNTLPAQSDLSEYTLEQLLTTADYCVGQSAIPTDLQAKNFVVAKGLKWRAHRLLNSIGRTKVADNDTNAIRSMNIFKGDPVEMRFLTNIKFWGFTTTGSDGSGPVWYERWPMRRGEDVDFHTNAFLYGCRCRDSFTIHEPRGFFGCSPQ